MILGAEVPTGYHRDASAVIGRADAMVRPEGFEDLERLVRWARETRIPLVARGGGSSLDGESVPVRGGVVVDFARWDRLVEVVASDGYVRVEPGLTQPALESALRPMGLTYPPNPSSGAASTLGGHASTNASGPRSFRYGPTRHWVRGLSVVDGRGRRWSAGGPSAKRSVGPDLVQLLVGSEGTLALFGELLLRVLPRPARRIGFAWPLPEPAPIGQWASELPGLLGPGLSALEYVDGVTAGSLRPPLADGEAPGGWVLAEWEGTEAEETELLERIDGGLGALGPLDPPSVFSEADRLWARRGEAGTALQQRFGPALREDVVVPVSALDALRDDLLRLAERRRVPLALFGHLGEGNLHPVLAVDPASPEADAIRRELLDRTLSLGGAISGEHGIGATKRDRLGAQVGAEGLALLRALKAELDPDGILNPGKLLPDPRRAAPRRSAASPSASAGGRTRPDASSGPAPHRARGRPGRRAARR